MLKAEYYSAPSELDVMIFEKLIPAEHYPRALCSGARHSAPCALV